mmetsp:Transcript_33239/g.103599  ORF Transcript_33239/g.103599 Transcript_33239/m.103599 type:complete len:284 (+) Transcript_33239:49-900(+)
MELSTAPTAVWATIWSALARALAERDFCWLVMFGFVAGSLGPWILFWLYKKLTTGWCPRSSRRRSHKAMERNRHLSVVRCCTFDPEAADEPYEGMRTVEHNFSEPEKELDPGESSAWGHSRVVSRKPSRVLVPDPKCRGKWKYVECKQAAPSSGSECERENTKQEEASDEGDLTPRLGPPTPRMSPDKEHAAQVAPLPKVSQQASKKLVELSAVPRVNRKLLAPAHRLPADVREASLVKMQVLSLEAKFSKDTRISALHQMPGQVERAGVDLPLPGQVNGASG